MGYSQADKAATHDRLVKIAARRLREYGVEGLGIAEVMGDAGLTVGGFYKHFASRDDLVTEALVESFKDLDAWESQAKSLVDVVQNYYLTEPHRDMPGTGCAICAMVGDMPRVNPDARELYTARFRRSVALAESLLAIESKSEKRQRALLLLSASVGAVNPSRAVSDKALSSEILHSVAKQLAPLLPGSAPIADSKPAKCKPAATSPLFKKKRA